MSGSNGSKRRKPTTRKKKDPSSALEPDEKKLPLAIGKLFELNDYNIEYSKKIHGAEVDIVATPKNNPFGSTIYIEATIQYVDNTKYGKDLTKFTLVRASEPECTCICISTSGFTIDVKERAGKSRILTYTYDELFSKFERFSPYVESILQNDHLIKLVNSYEQPLFKDKKGEHSATIWLKEWKTEQSPESNWLVILGEYGTGKTALTQNLQYEWTNEYKLDPSQPIPIRIELRNFSRQFDSRSLIHHFLDTNRLGHVPIEHFFYLLRNKRIVLILDGYDEMAQFLNPRERRSCLAALAELAAEGAKGILTSRPNYFTESEELNVFEALYTTLEQKKYHLSETDKVYIAKEKSIDELLQNYLINRNDRYLRDLTPEQTKSLVRRNLANDEVGQSIVITLLEKVFREESTGQRQSLSGKPVIISYLLEILEDLRSSTTTHEQADLSEWQIYKLIVDKLMLRDFHRSPGLHPDQRRVSLQLLAVNLSRRDSTTATEEMITSIIDNVFKTELRRLTAEDRRLRRDELFQDIRSSTTLTRSENTHPSGWIFSHNSLREYLATELIVGNVINEQSIDIKFPISPVMRTFVSSLSGELAEKYLTSLKNLWTKKSSNSLGEITTISFDLLKSHKNGLLENLIYISGESLSNRITLKGASFSNVEISKESTSSDRLQIDAENSSFTESSFNSLDLENSNFSSSTLDRVDFTNCNLNSCSFSESLIFECNLTGASFDQTNFKGIDREVNFITHSPSGNPIILNGERAIGYLKYHGAITDHIAPYYELEHHPKFPIILKICENITEQRKSQLRGLTQRGSAQSDPRFARAFVEHLTNINFITVDQNDLVSATADGRKELPRLVEHKTLPEEIENFLRDYK